MKSTVKKQILEKVNDFLQHAYDDELQVADNILEGLLNKQRQRNKKGYIDNLFQVKKEFSDDGLHAKVSIPITPLTDNSIGMVHGGVSATLLDLSMGSLVNQYLPEDKHAVTLELKINYIKPGKGKTLTCISDIVHTGRTIAVSEAKIYNEQNSLIASGVGTFYIIDSKK